MDDKLFLIAIGGTGMRCLESFVHLCAAGLFDNRTIDILTLDTDQNNGNKGRVEDLINLYNRVKTNDSATPGGQPRSNTFFSAKLNLYKFFTDYSDSKRRTLVTLAQTPNLTEEQRADNQDLSDLLFDRDTVQQFHLDHGYRAQTHLGSMLMYHGIIEAALSWKRGGKDVKPQEKELVEFLQLISKHQAQARVFVFGSVFGGTGASSIPVIPLAFSEALKVINGKELNLNQVLFGSTLLTDYFNFNAATSQQLQGDKVVAQSTNFAINSQAALSFYEKDQTVRSTYKRMYHIGFPSELKINYSEGQPASKVLTGGHEQKNPCHLAELMCAVAAYDFFEVPRPELAKVGVAEYVFRTVEVDDHGVMRLTGNSFVGDKNHAGEIFENKLGAFLSLAHMILSKFHGADETQCGMINLLNYFSEMKFEDYSNLSDEQCREIDEYFKEFAYKFVRNTVVFGWIYQIYKSVGNAQFIFAPEAFRSNPQELADIDPGTIFLDEYHHWDKDFGVSSASERRFSRFMKMVKSDSSNPTEQQAQTLKEAFLAHMYNALTQAQHFDFA
ncbi:MAG: hypothetical protein LUC85_07120 [Bacteroidales bacterium]|nr:hypothetical protein [Bacteroidales bacterium]MCD8394591.1 hypothetical protein [Bacteroidales bacterium]